MYSYTNLMWGFSVYNSNEIHFISNKNIKKSNEIAWNYIFKKYLKNKLTKLIRHIWE